MKYVIFGFLAATFAYICTANKSTDNVQLGNLSNEEYYNYVVDQVNHANDCKFWQTKNINKEGC